MTTISSIRQPVATLSGGQRQSVAVAKAVQWNSKLVILDEPTAALGVAQTEQVLALVRAPRRAGPRGRDHLAQPARHLRDRRPDHRAAARPERRRLRPARRRPSRRSSRRSPPGKPTKVSGIRPLERAGAGGRRRRDSADVLGPDASEAGRRRRASARPRGTVRPTWDNIRTGNLGVGADHRRP